MEIYLGFMFVVILLVAAYDIFKKRFYYYLATIVMGVFAGIRYRVGTDYVTYEMMFESAKIADLKTYEGDKGFLLISKFISFFTDNIRVNFFVISFFITVMIMIFIFKNSKIKFLSVTLYFALCGYFAAFNIMRQFIAVAIIAYAIQYLNTNKNIKYYSLILIASTFHTTAIIMLPMKILIDIKWGKKIYSLIILTTLAVYLNVNYFVSLFSSNERISGYVDSYYTNVGGNPITFIVYLVIFLFCVYNKTNIENGINNKFLKLSFIGLMFVFIGTKGLIFARIATYFNLGILITVPDAFLGINKKKYCILGYLILICLLVYCMVGLKTQGNLIPYRFK